MSRKTRRLKLHEVLKNIPGVKDAYFQPPATIHMEYPCIVYSYDGQNTSHADGLKYLKSDRYSVTLITKDPMPDETLSALDSIDYSRFSRSYNADNLHHFSYDLVITERI